MGGTLAKVESAAEQAVVFGLLGSQTIDPVWIGLQDFLSEGTFSWSDGTALGSYTNWVNSQPDNNNGNQHCVVVIVTGGNSGLWNDVICGGARPFICETAISSS